MPRIYLPMSEETKQKISIANKGKKISDETRAKMSASQRARPFHHKHTDEAKLKISLGNTGKKRTPEQIKRMIEAHVGLVVSEETKRKISIANTGRKSHYKGVARDPAIGAKIRETKLKRNAERRQANNPPPPEIVEADEDKYDFNVENYYWGD